MEGAVAAPTGFSFGALIMRRISDADRKRIHELPELGSSCREIADRDGYSHNTVVRVLNLKAREWNRAPARKQYATNKPYFIKRYQDRREYYLAYVAEYRREHPMLFLGSYAVAGGCPPCSSNV
jgi:IS30 family transposase